MTRQVRSAAMVLLSLFLVPPVWGQQYFLYSPRPATVEESKEPKDGVLVRELEVRKGDTLYGISSKLSGHGMYYPQILFSNDIKNPNLIHAGDTLKVPVTKEHPAEEASVVPVRKKKGTGRKQAKYHKPRVAAAVPADRQPAVATQAPGALTELSTSELKHSDKGKKKRRVSKQAETGGQKLVKREHGEVPPASVDRKPAAAKPVVVSRQQEQRPSGTDTAAQMFFERAVKAYRKDDCRTALDLFERFLTSYPASPQAADASLYKAECYLKLSGQ